MTTEPNLQLNLYGFNLIFDEIIALHKNNKLPHKMLFSGPKGSGKSTLAYHIINYIFSSKEEFSYNLKEKLINSLEFKLTNSQFFVLNEIQKDLESSRQMIRLLQGDVGSGKTIVALISMIIVIESGYQTTLMAPTSILAYQHYENISKLLKNLPIKVEILTKYQLLNNMSAPVEIAIGEFDQNKVEDVDKYSF